MAPARTRERSSDDMDEPATQRQTVPTKTGTPPMLSSSPSKRQRIGITLEQKQAIIDNLQLEITDRARRLRAQYHQQAQTLRSRIQMRVNRVPRSMLKMTMADLLANAIDQQRRLEAASRPPPVPEKDFPPRTNPHKLAPPGRSTKRLSDAMAGGDKENEQILNPKKKHRAAPPPTLSSSQILSPTSSNTRSVVRERPPSPPSKAQFGRPQTSPVKQHNSARSALSSMVEKAKNSSRAGPSRGLASSTNSSNASAPVTSSAPATTRTKRANTTTATKAPPRPATRTGKRVSDSSEGSTGTVVKKTTASAAPAKTKRTVMATIRKGVGAATTRKPAVPKTASASTTGSTRVLRKRG